MRPSICRAAVLRKSEPPLWAISSHAATAGDDLEQARAQRGASEAVLSCRPGAECPTNRLGVMARSGAGPGPLPNSGTASLRSLSLPPLEISNQEAGEAGTDRRLAEASCEAPEST